jgi:hypothetical protein
MLTPHPHSLILSMKWSVDEVLCWRKAVSTKCCVDEMPCRRNVLSTKYLSTKCLSTKCPVDEVLCRRKFFDKNLSTICLSTNFFRPTTYLLLETASHHKISLTAKHLIPVASDNRIMKYIAAEHVKARHDSLYVLSEGRHIILSLVTRVSIETKVGIFAPLTTTGKTSL